jgi:hypothetical protein
MKPLLCILILIFAAGCSVIDDFLWSSPNSAASNIRFTTDDFDSVIFTAENAAQTGLSFEFNEPIVDTWTPTKEDVLALENDLLPYLEQELTPDHYAYRIIEDLPLYTRQYFGIVLTEGQPLIYANYFCNAENFDYWLEGNVMVMDGGECFFQVLYNPEDSSFLWLRVNGFA